MAKRFYTILILPDATSKIRKFYITHKNVKILGYVAGFVLVVFIALSFLMVHLGAKSVELKKLRTENREQKQQLQIFSTKVENLERTMVRLKEFDQKLRVITDLDRPSASGGAKQVTMETPLVGVGGPAEQDKDPLSRAMQAERSAISERMNQSIDRLQNEVKDQEKSFQEIRTFLEDRKSSLASTPTIWPVRGFLTSGFGWRNSPYTNRRQMHEGIDIATRRGTPVRTTAHGIVVGSAFMGGNGLTVLVDHGFGYRTQYSHLQSAAVRVGQRLQRGDLVGYVGTSGVTTGPHLHYEVHVNGVPVNPARYLLD